MKHFNTIAIFVLSTAVVALYILHFTSLKKNSTEVLLQKGDSIKTSQTDSFSIAYVSVDSLLINYQFAKEMNEVLLKKQEKFRNDISRKQEQLQADAMAVQKKFESGGFLTRESVEQEQTRLMKKEQELQNLDRRFAQELFAEQQKINTQLRDSINTFFKVYNQDKRYKVIFSDTGNDNIFYAEDYLDITADVIDKLNARYKPAEK